MKARINLEIFAVLESLAIKLGIYIHFYLQKLGNFALIK